MRQLNIRIPDELDDALQAHVKATGEKQSAVVRRGIELATRQQARVPAIPPTPSPAAESPAEELQRGLNVLRERKRENAATVLKDVQTVEIDLATWLAGRTGLPRAVLVRRITAGKVEIDGRPRYAEKVPAADLRGQVTLDGNPV